MRPIELTVDLTDAHRRIIHVEADVPVQPGLTASLTTPLWICESHEPNGPVGAIAGLFFSAEGSTLAWRREVHAPFIYLIDVPSGISTVHASFDAIISSFVTRRMVMLTWESVLLHHAFRPVSHALVKSSVVIPRDWAYSTALFIEATDERTHHAGTTISFAPVTVERLEDSPLLVGQHISQLMITSDEKHILCVAASTADLARVPQRTMGKLRCLIGETHAVFGDAPYASYRFLVMTSQILMPERGMAMGREHAESSHLLVCQDLLVDQELLEQDGDVISHEFCHAWNGKYLRPAGHVPTDFITPLDGSLLWVYEGLTQYYGYVLAARSGMMTLRTFRTKLANTVAEMANQAGRLWRSVEDTGTGVCLGKGLGQRKIPHWGNWLRAGDYYSEGALLWLDVDTLIRQDSGNRMTLDDFCGDFFASKNDSKLEVLPYTLEQLQSALCKILPHDWAAFFEERVRSVSPEVNTGGIERAGYRFTYSDSSSSSQETNGAKISAIWYFLGVRINSEGLIEDVKRFGSADSAKLAPTQTITHVNDENFSIDVFLAQIKRAKDSQRPLRLALTQDEDSWVSTVDGHDGLRYPTLVRQSGEQDMLAAIIAPRCNAL